MSKHRSSAVHAAPRSRHPVAEDRGIMGIDVRDVGEDYEYQDYCYSHFTSLAGELIWKD